MHEQFRFVSAVDRQRIRREGEGARQRTGDVLLRMLRRELSSRIDCRTIHTPTVAFRFLSACGSPFDSFQGPALVGFESVLALSD